MSLVRAIESQPRPFFSPFFASFWMGSRVSLLSKSAVSPPPWMTNPGTMRWKMVPSKKPSSTYFRKFSTVTGASFGNSSMVKEPCEVSNLTMVEVSRAVRGKKGSTPLGLGHALVPGEIAVRAYVTEAARDKFACDVRRLVRAVLEEQPAVTLEVVRGRRNDCPEAGHPVPSGGEGAAWLVAERGVL